MPVQPLLEQRVVDIIQSDLRRAGDHPECYDAGLVVSGFDVPPALDGGGVHLHVLAALPNTLFMESGLGLGQLVDGGNILPENPIQGPCSTEPESSPPVRRSAQVLRARGDGWRRSGGGGEYTFQGAA